MVKIDWGHGDELITVRRRQHDFGVATLSVLINVVILNLFVEHVDEVVIDSFSISVLTAILLTVLVRIMSRFEHRVRGWFFARGRKVLGFLSVWAILFLGKFVILEVVDIVFGDHVELGHLLEVILLVFSMLVVEALFRKLYEVLGRPIGQPEGAAVDTGDETGSDPDDQSLV